MDQVYPDERRICTLEPGRTREAELNPELNVWHPGKPQGLVVKERSGLSLHYYTNEDRTAVLCAACRKGVLESVRLGLGMWGPLAEAPEVPPEAVSESALECLGTGHGVHLDQDRARILRVYGPPRSESGNVLRYRWPFGVLEFTLEGDRVVMIHLKRSPEDGTELRPLPPDAGPVERTLPLSASLNALMQAGERDLRAGRAAEALARFEEVLEVLDEDPDPSSVKAHVMSRRALARARLGRGKEALEEVARCRRYLEHWNPADSPEVLEIRFTEGCVQRLSGRPQPARRGLQGLWRDLHASAHYHEPRVYGLVRPLARELEALGDGGPAEMLRRLDA